MTRAVWVKYLQGVKRWRKITAFLLVVVFNLHTNSAYAATTYGFFLKICGQPTPACHMYLMGIIEGQHIYRELVGNRIRNWSKQNNYKIPLGAYYSSYFCYEKMHQQNNFRINIVMEDIRRKVFAYLRNKNVASHIPINTAGQNVLMEALQAILDCGLPNRASGDPIW